MAKNLANVDLNLLVALDALLAERNVTRAAERLQIGQSAMSSTLARLRRFFDDPLLIRKGRGMITTPLADSLIGPVRNALSTIESVLINRSEFDPHVDQRVFTISASDYVTLVLLRPLIQKLANVSPSVRVRVIPVNTTDYTEDLRHEQADLLILPLGLIPATSGYTQQIVFTDDYVVAVDEDNPNVGDALTLEQFSALPYLAYQSGGRASLVDIQLDQLNIPRNTEVTAQSFLIAPLLLRGTPLMMLAHRRMGQLLAEQHELKLLPTPMDLQPLEQVMVWTPRYTNDAAHTWLREHIMTVAAEQMYHD